MFNYNSKNNPNIGFFRYSNNNNHNFVNRNKLDQNNPYIGYFSQYNNKNLNLGNLIKPVQTTYYPYFKLNPFIISKLISNIGTNVILFDDNFSQIHSKYNYQNFFNSYNKKYFKYCDSDTINTERETIESVDANTQTDSEILSNNEIGIQTEEINSYESINSYYDKKYNSDNNLSSSDDSIFLKNSMNTDLLCALTLNGEQKFLSSSDDEESDEENDSGTNKETEDSLEDEYVLIN